MKFKASYFNVSLPLVKENLRRFWAIPVISFLMYFLSGAVPILMSYSHINDMADYIQMCLTNQQPFYMAIHLIMPIITAVIVFRYLQAASSVTAMHAMPFTRATLYNSSVVSGLILTILPIAVNEIILLLIAKPTYFAYGYIIPANAENVFSRIDVLSWFWHSLIIILVIYAIAVFAGLVTGNSIMHLAAAFGFNFLVPALYGTFIVYCYTYLFGFASNGNWEEILTAISPYLQVFSFKDHFPIGLQIYYILNAVVLFALSGMLYQKRKLERTSDSLVFSFMIPIINYLIAFFGMSLVGFYFTSLDSEQGKGYMYSGLIAGAIIFFILGRMIVMKTPRVFNKQSFKNFGIYAILAIIFVTSITLDLSGFEDRVPASSTVKGVYSTTFNDFNDMGRLSPSVFNSRTKEDKQDQNPSDQFYYKDPQNIKAITQLHSSIIDSKVQLKDSDYNGLSQTIFINYINGFPLGMQRSYHLDYGLIASNPYCKELFESKEFKDFFSMSNLNYERIVSINLQDQFYSIGYDRPGINISNPSKINELLSCFDKDFQARTFEQHISCLHAYGTATISYKMISEDDKLVNNSIELRVLQSDTNTLGWLKENRYESTFVINPSSVKSITFYKYDKEEQDKYYKNLSAEQAKSLDESIEPKVVITDKAQIQEILSSYCTDRTNYDQYYHGFITFARENKPDNSFDNNSNYGESSFGDIYYTDQTVPAFIKKAF
ncbi:hypothetical protein [Clostridium aminobutyricum]|uniref:Uncharacterized protein n=1 Tax=Clostridium aminobutyricum TaxID=33953 RepID=A0A939D6N7_CLOAM|nr:hypothetical protein [Clostridium aminobutyricum]MBN7772087.1 hypothetical protein [Clostridium aminobutyricum]